jgi:hypothetical protein
VGGAAATAGRPRRACAAHRLHWYARWRISTCDALILSPRSTILVPKSEYLIYIMLIDIWSVKVNIVYTPCYVRVRSTGRAQWVGTTSRAPTGGRVLEGVIKLPHGPPQAQIFGRC